MISYSKGFTKVEGQLLGSKGQFSCIFFKKKINTQISQSCRLKRKVVNKMKLLRKLPLYIWNNV